MFQLINRCLTVVSELFEPKPNQACCRNMVALASVGSALALGNARKLLFFAVKLLDLPTQAALIVSILRGILRQVVGYQPLRAVGGDLYPEQPHLDIEREFVQFDQFALLPLDVRPIQFGDCSVGLLAIAVVNFPVRFERAVKDLVLADNQLHKICRGVPTVHQHVAEQQSPVQGTEQHIPHVVELGLTVPFGVKNPVVDDPESVIDWVVVNAVDHADALDDAVLVARVLTPDALNFIRVNLLENHIIKNQIPFQAACNQRFDFLPKQFGRQVAFLKEAADVIVGQVGKMISQIRAGVVDLAREKVLTVNLAGCFHPIS